MSSHLESTQIPTRGWTFNIALQLGRVSNLPTVWTNTLAAVLLSGVSITPNLVLLLMFAMSLAYTGGMYLNDAFDRHIDAAQRPERPIPSGRVSARDVFLAGFAMLLVSVAVVSAVGSLTTNTTAALISSSMLALAIVSYNRWHKGNSLSPVLMGLCRMLVYISCALTVSAVFPALVVTGALVVFSYLIGLTYTAKQEHLGRVSTLWPLGCLIAPVLLGMYHANDNVLIIVCTMAITLWTLYCLRLIFRRHVGDIPKAVTGLIAGIALIDALLVAIAASTYGFTDNSTLFLAGACWSAFGLTLAFQRFIAGT